MLGKKNKSVAEAKDSKPAVAEEAKKKFSVESLVDDVEPLINALHAKLAEYSKDGYRLTVVVSDVTKICHLLTPDGHPGEVQTIVRR